MAGDNNRTFLASVEGEISFFRSIMRARPIGIHRHFHVLAIQRFIHKDTGRLVHITDIWDKLRSCYNLDALEAIDLDAEAYELSRSNGSTPSLVRSPSPSAPNLFVHPYFREEYSLPVDESFESLISQRRMRATASVPSSPAPSHVAVATKSRGGKRRGKTKLDMAGLVGGDSDSSALTQESGDEGTTGTGRLGSVATGTDGGTDYAEEDVEMGDPSPASPKATRHRSKPGKKRGRPPAGSTMTRATKKRKR